MDAPWWNGDEPDPHPEGRWPEPDVPLFCDGCGADAFYPVTHPSFGVFCSVACLDAAESKFVNQMQRLAKASGE